MEHLETDVMRFMAILAFCLVAIFALVQSVPQPRHVAEAPAPPPPAAPASETIPRPAPGIARQDPPAIAAPEPATPGAEPRPPAVVTPDAVAAAPVPEPVPDRRPADERLTETRHVEAPPPVSESTIEPVPEPTPASQAPAESDPDPREGFSLRFDSDTALVGLVERDEVALYAFARDRVWRFMIVDGRPAFRSAVSPGQIHEMTPDTVPVQVLDTLRRSVVVPAGGLRWGVTLPPPTAAALTRVMQTNDGGELVIDADGFLRLEDRS